MRPLHPETRGLLAETYGLMNDLAEMRACIAESVQTFDNMDTDGISQQSLASVYHKLATVFLSKELGADAIPLLQRSLNILPNYLPALVDITASHVMNKDKRRATEALSKLSSVAPNHSQIAQLRKAISRLK